jgi:DMSO/TMAO reductase YedYZ molybdopterin-dependent catalytic subunit
VAILDRVPRLEDFRSPVHNPRLTARLGLWLGGGFLVCFLTGLVSHVHQHPLPFLVLPPEPSWAYRLNQGLHVATGTASVPLLLAKMYAVYPRLFERPLLGGPLRILERGSIAVLVGASFLQVLTGVANVAQWYYFGFFFTTVHFAFAWAAIGALAVHVAVKLPVVREALSRPLADATDAPADARDRRWFLGSAIGVAAGAVALTVGSAVPALESVSVLRSRRPSTSPNGIPINRTAAGAGITEADVADGWRLELRGPSGVRSLALADLSAMPNTTVDLPISCVEGWSAIGTWTGVRVRDLAALVGGSGQDVRVVSLERDGMYASSVLPSVYADHDDTVLAIALEGAPLSLDHGRPARIIAPNRPGVLQTKWVTRLEVGT